jgi:DNA-binding SARP family transcriptional activator
MDRACDYRAAFFGHFQVDLPDGPLGQQVLRRNGVRTLLKWFLLNPGERFSTGQLCGLLWPDRDVARAANGFHVTLHYLRRGLEPGLPRGAVSSFVASDHGHYWFELGGRWWTDALEVAGLASAAEEAERRGDPAGSIVCHERALGYYELTFLPEDIYDDNFESYRSAYQQGHVRTLDALMRLYLDEDRLASAHALALQALAADPYAEAAVKTLVLVHLGQGDPAAAVRRLDELSQVLDRDLGAAPGNELRRLGQAIRSGHLRSLPPRGPARAARAAQ